ncbi:unnamed protein product [Mytilus coruscus]|uniref:B box-type domain-containing protein n=1 Tax=Mytilus coruscus TaxID=42192 RepID=A0A6J8DIA4_MYTCO|nr:unnamed protein product [Mytilus coruscus]
MDMATNESALFYDVCQNRDLNKSVKEYCPQCEDAICQECRDHDKISKLSKSHQTFSFDKYRKLSSCIMQIKHNCEEHDCFLEFYCKSHGALCCKLCLISGHKECQETIFIEEFFPPSSRHQSASLDTIVKVLKDLERNISSVIKYRNRNLTDLREQKRIIGKQFKEKRFEINTHLDNLDRLFLEKASAVEREICRKIENNKFLKYEPNGKFTSESRILPDQDYFGFDFAVVGSHMVAISCGGNPPTQICLINLKSAELHQILCLGDWSFHNGSVICCTYDKSIQIFDRSCQNSTNVRLLPNVPNRVDETYVTSNEIGIFHSNWRDNSVVCYDFSGQEQ